VTNIADMVWRVRGGPSSVPLRSRTVQAVQKHVLPGHRVRLVRFAPSEIFPTGEPGFKGGELGTVDMVDDAGTVAVHWDNGRTLGLCLDDDFDVFADHVIEEGGFARIEGDDAGS
jgi:hypothetical protein